MKRFLKISTLLIVCLFLLVSGVDATLDHISHSTRGSTFTWYSEKGDVILAYEGDISQYRPYAKPTMVPRMSSRSSTISSESGYSLF